MTEEGIDLNAIRDRVRRGQQSSRIHRVIQSAETIGQDIQDAARIVRDVLHVIEVIVTFSQRRWKQAFRIGLDVVDFVENARSFLKRRSARQP